MKVVKPETVVIALMVLAACGSRRLGPTRADAGADTPDALIEGAGGSAEVDGFAVRLDTKAPAAEGRDAVSVEAAAPDTTVSTCECGLASAATCDGWTLWEKVTASGAHTVGGYCYGSSDPAPDGGDPIVGRVVFDEAGQVVDASGVRVQELLPSLASYRWPCYANRTISFACVEGYE